MDILVAIVITLLAISIFGYIFSIMKEKQDLMQHRVVIKSEKVTQRILDDLDMKMFKLGKFKLFVGDVIRVKLKNKQRIKGILLGAKRKSNALWLVTPDDEIIELNVKTIEKLSIISKYGRLF
ncbi:MULTISPECIES: hypothetical protein [unclassified Fusibacter]|uniref:hypothetical protein n=1 Tax=unclassified Fusibacter TaxID=2624464 RepID=UPI0010109FC4|nr:MULTISPECIES: hypothetical protein [unclassified Fusibacter]MCK8058024.1 hypothetical protein [Fusibacter sp. A2]NPE20606.1 hypothetical protein [Fusibacter sp. A1]RXV62813.1 hypothetical protein DWB64_02145 [Fusibacter sp. A1]